MYILPGFECAIQTGDQSEIVQMFLERLHGGSQLNRVDAGVIEQSAIPFHFVGIETPDK